MMQAVLVLRQSQEQTCSVTHATSDCTQCVESKLVLVVGCVGQVWQTRYHPCIDMKQVTERQMTPWS